MNPLLGRFGDLLFGGPAAVIGGILGIILFFGIVAVAKMIVRVMLPDKMLVVTGRRKKVKGGKEFGFTVERGRTHVWPYFNQIGSLELGILPINVRVDGVNAANGITVGADATACVCIDDDNEALLYSAVERLMGKSRDEIYAQIRQTLIGNFRGALNKATPLQAIGMEEKEAEAGAKEQEKEEKEEEGGGEFLVDLTDTKALKEGKIPVLKGKVKALEGERAHFRNELLKDINSDLSHFGMRVVSVSLQNIWDGSNYIANLAQKTLAQKRQEVEIEEKRLRAIALQSESDSQRRKSVAKSQADEKILRAQQKVEVFRRESEAHIQQARLEADSAIAEAQNKGERDIQEQLVELQKLKNTSKVILEAEARQRTAQIIAQGEKEAVLIREKVRNHILRQKAEMIAEAGDLGKVVLFIKQQLPYLFEAYRQHVQGLAVNSFVIMDEKTGFNGAVNRGPAAFVDFLHYLEQGFGVSVRELLSANVQKSSQPLQKKEE
jgi:flotillin